MGKNAQPQIVAQVEPTTSGATSDNGFSRRKLSLSGLSAVRMGCAAKSSEGEIPVRNRAKVTLAIGIACVMASTGALAADPGPTCKASKLGTSGKYAQCRLKADSKAAKAGTTADYSKCGLERFSSAEIKSAGMCPTSGDQTTVKAYLDGCTSRVALWLGGGGGLPDNCASDLSSCEGDLSTTNSDLAACEGNLAVCESSTCGDNAAGFGESCDGADLKGKSCATETPATPHGTLACDGNCNGFVTSGCKARFTDNYDGTVTDNATGLMWEQKTTDYRSGIDYSDPHDVDNTYTWSAAASAPDGTAFTDFLDKLNGQGGGGTGFAGYYDWRLPTVEELQGIRDCSSGFPCVDPAFGPTAIEDVYWTSTTLGTHPTSALCESFLGVFSTNTAKVYGRYVRAVRAGT